MTLNRKTAVLVRIQAKPGHHEDVMREARRIFARIRRAEPSCTYIVGHYDGADPTRLMFFEEWRDRDEFLEFRGNREYLHQYLDRLQDYVDDISVSLWSPFSDADEP